ncbi:MAG: hypothetical protein E7474_04350 [Ruminococcaceae bacterium]|nr:hypothetical protein [Oscillospiraceae bacterium]
MNIYLFELDSVRNSKQEIAAGQDALFREITANGNTVILSYNQLSDSAAFWAGLKDEKTYNAVMELCELGMIQVSLYADQRTAAQYILGHVKSCMKQLEKRRNSEDAEKQDFYFSLVPLDDNDGDMLRDVYRAIQYSDVQLLREKARENTGDREKYLFLSRYVELILLLSRSETANHPQKSGPLKSLLDYMEQVGQMFSAPQGDEGIDAVLARGLAILRRISDGVSREELQRRSVWYKLLETEPYTKDIDAAEAIVDLCYNYAVEDSILDVDKRYCDGDAEDFRKQFRIDMARYWYSVENGEHISHRKDDARRIAQTDFSENVALPEWSTALLLVKRNIEYIRKRGKRSLPDTQGKDRGERLAQQRRYWKKLSKRSLRYSLMVAGLYAAAFVAISYLLNVIQDLWTDALSVRFGVGGKLLINFISIVLFGIVTSELFAHFKLPDILETVENVFNGIHENRMLYALEREYHTHKGGNC